MDTLTRRRRRWNGGKRPHDQPPAVQPEVPVATPSDSHGTPKDGWFDRPRDQISTLEILLGCYGIGIEWRRRE